MRIDGKKIAEKIISDLHVLPNPDKVLAAVLVGDNAESLSFLKQKERISESLGIPFQLFRYRESISEPELINAIRHIGDDPEVGGIIVQLPLPPHYDRDSVLAAINPSKDIDAMTEAGKKLVAPLPVEVVKDVLNFAGRDILSQDIAIVGRGFLVGRPLMEWLDSIGKSYKLFHSQTDISEVRDCNLIITGVGKGGLIKQEFAGPDTVIIDFGYDFAGGKIKGDFVPDEDFSGWYTPTPGGTGPILVAEIFKNFYKLNLKK